MSGDPGRRVGQVHRRSPDHAGLRGVRAALLYVKIVDGHGIRNDRRALPIKSRVARSL